MFEELEQKENIGDCAEDSIIQTRQFFGLSLPDIEVETLESEISEVGEFECFQIESEVTSEENVEYIYDHEESEIEMSELQEGILIENDDFTKQDIFDSNCFEDDMVDYSDASEQMFQEAWNENDVNDTETCQVSSDDKIEIDDISKHFE